MNRYLRIRVRQRGILISAAILVALSVALVVSDSPARAFDTSAKQVIMVDDITGAVLFEKSSDSLMHPASMSKLMTLYVTFGLIAEGQLSLDTELSVSERAWRMGGSRMFVDVGSQVSVRDLLRGIIIQSGNDACVVLAEGITGSESEFVDLMNKKAASIGLSSSNFMNVTGWPHPDHLTTARDLAVLAHRIIHDFPQFYRIFEEKQFEHNDITQANRNPLLGKYHGADGLKTGHTEAAGYGLTASALRDGRRIILVANGMTSSKQRSSEAERLLDHGFQNFGNYELFKAGDVIDEIDVWLGKDNAVPLVIDNDVTLTLSRTARAGMVVRILRPEGPVAAPVEPGQTVANLNIEAPGMRTINIPLKAGRAVERLSGFGRIGAAFSYLIWGEQG